MSDQADQNSADTDDTKQAPSSSEEPETTVVASDTTHVERPELAWSRADPDELSAERRSWTDTLRITALAVAAARASRHCAPPS